MNLSCNKPVTPCAGETLTITCFTCGMPSSKEWAQRVRSRSTNPLKPYFPFLLHLQPPQGSSLREDGTTYVCAFCHASLESQWKSYERQPSDIPPVNRKYDLHKFICAVCGVETYRKRVRTLPFQEFPFLANQRPAGSLTLGNNPLAVVCLDCSETLWAQSAEYDRWGLPIHKRRFNWLARPPPDPDSLEATVARLPSGETQLPRCPPTEPLIKPKEIPAYESGGKHRIRSSKSESNSGSESNVSARKSSLPSQSNASLEAIGVHSQPPIVTVAPMSAHSTTLSSHKKETLSVPPNLTSSQYPKYESISTSCVQPSQLGHPLFPRSPIFPPSTYGPFPWGTRESSIGEQYPYPPSDEALQPSSGSTWAWMPPPASNLIQYPSYLPSSFSNRSYNINDTYYSSSHSYYPPSPESNAAAGVTATISASSHYLSNFSTQNSTRSASPHHTSLSQKSTIPHVGSANSRHSISLPCTYDQETSPPIRRGSSSDIKSGSNVIQEPVLKKTNLKHTSNSKSLLDVSTCTLAPKKPAVTTTVHKEVNFKSTTNISGGDSFPTNFKPKSNAIRNHINEKIMNSVQRKLSPDRVYIPSPSSSMSRKTAEDSVPKKWQWQTYNLEKSRGRSLSESEPMDCSISSQEALSRSPPTHQTNVGQESESSTGASLDTVIDLSLPASHKNNGSSGKISSRGTSKNKFMIAYLCQSESTATRLKGSDSKSSINYPQDTIDTDCESNAISSHPASRQSVIIAAAKPENSDLSNMDCEVTSSEQTNTNSSPSNHGSDQEEDTRNTERNHTSSTSGDTFEKSLKVNSECSCSSKYPEETPVTSEKIAGDAKDESSNSELSLDAKCTRGEIAQDYVRKAISEHKTGERQAKQLKRKLEEDQEDFLETLGLVTLRKKTEHELNMLIKRSNHCTLPPLKLRPSTPHKVQLGEDFENQLLKVAFDDPSLKKSDLSEDEVAFLAQLDLKPATKLDKNNREVQWRIVLMERMMREKRGAKFCGTKKLWNSDLASSKFQLPTKTHCNNPSLFGSLSVTLPTFSNECVTNTESPGSSDLLRIAETRSGSPKVEKSTKAETTTVSATYFTQPVISYPKYIPSYASQASVSSNAYAIENAKASHPSSGPVSSRTGSPDTSSKSLVGSNATEENTTVNVQTKCPALSNQISGEDSRILKVPVINKTVDPFKSVAKEMDGSVKEILSIIKDEIPSTCKPSSIIDGIIDADALNCENFINQINSLLNSFPATSKKGVKDEGQVVWLQSETEWKKLKKYLKSRQNQVKAIEDKLRKREKQILNQLRACTNNTH